MNNNKVDSNVMVGGGATIMSSLPKMPSRQLSVTTTTLLYKASTQPSYRMPTGRILY